MVLQDKLLVTLYMYFFVVLYSPAHGSVSCKTKYVTEKVCQGSYGTELQQITERSVVECSRRCAALTDCVSYMYDLNAKWCRMNAEEASGFDNTCATKVVYGRLEKATCRDHWLYEPCSNTECPVPNSYCHDNICTCNIGYTYTHRSDSCVASCTGGYGSRFSSHPGSLRHFNNKIVTVTSVDECRALCRDETSFTCRSIDFSPDTQFDCFLSTETAVTQPANYEGLPTDYVTNLRNCA